MSESEGKDWLDGIDPLEKVEYQIKLKLIHSQDRYPNYRDETGALFLYKCFECEEFELNPAEISNIPLTSCPKCCWAEDAHFDWNEIQLALFEAMIWPIFNAAVLKWGRTEQELRQVAACLAKMIVDGAGEGCEFLFDPSLIYSMEINGIAPTCVDIVAPYLGMEADLSYKPEGVSAVDSISSGPPQEENKEKKENV